MKEIYKSKRSSCLKKEINYIHDGKLSNTRDEIDVISTYVT